MRVWLCAQFRSLLFRRSVGKKVTTSDFRTGQILEQIWATQRRMKLDVEMETRVVAAVSRRLVQRHYIREGHLPKIIELHQHLLQQRREVAEFVGAQRGDAL